MKTFQTAFLATSALFLLAIIQSTHAELAGTFPAEGGQITIAPTDGPVRAGGIELSPTSGTLTRGDSPAPFAFFIPNAVEPENVTWGVLGTPVTIDGPVSLDVTASADAVIDATWGNGVVPTPFPIVGGGTFPDPFDPPVVGTGLEGVFPAEGGKLTVTPIGGPILAGGIELIPTRGTLTEGESPAPFQFFLPNSNAPENVTLASLGTGVTIDGPLTLDVTFSADAIVRGNWGDGPTPVPFSIFGGGGDPVDPVDPGTGGGNEVMDTPPLTQESINVAIEDLGPVVLESQLLVLFPEGGGPLTLLGTNGPVDTLGVEFIVDEGSIIRGDSAEPFQFFLGDDPGRIVLGSLGVPVTIDEPITLDIFASADAVLSGAWGEGNLATFPAFAVPNVPEPSSGLMAAFGLLGLLAQRRRNRSKVDQ